VAFWAKTLKQSHTSYKEIKGAVTGLIELNDDSED